MFLEKYFSSCFWCIHIVFWSLAREVGAAFKTEDEHNAIDVRTSETWMWGNSAISIVFLFLFSIVFLFDVCLLHNTKINISYRMLWRDIWMYIKFYILSIYILILYLHCSYLKIAVRACMCVWVCACLCIYSRKA